MRTYAAINETCKCRRAKITMSENNLAHSSSVFDKEHYIYVSLSLNLFKPISIILQTHVSQNSLKDQMYITFELTYRGILLLFSIVHIS